VTEPDKLVFEGWYFDGSTKGHDLKVTLDGNELPLDIHINKGVVIRQKYIGTVNEINEEVVATVTLPDGWKYAKRLEIHSCWEGEQNRDCSIPVRKLIKISNEIPYYIENCHRANGKVTVSGWCVAEGDMRIVISAGNEPLASQKVEHYFRKDLVGSFPECDGKAKFGFMVEADLPHRAHGAIRLNMRCSDRLSRVRITKWDGGNILQKAVQKLIDALRYFNRNGAGATARKIASKIHKTSATTYDVWRKKYQVTSKELAAEREDKFDDGPLFSIVVPAYKTNPRYLREMIESVQNQTYGKYELCIALAGSDEDTERLAGIIGGYAAKDNRIRLTHLEENLGISGNTNAALNMASGCDYIVLADHDDIIPPNALYEFADAVRKDPKVEVIYSDEDKVDMAGKKYFEPHFKPDFNIDLLCSVNYICHLFAVRRDVAERAGQFDPEFDGAQDHDFILRCTEQASDICHIPKILYHWRCHSESTAERPESKLYAFEAGKRAVKAHYDRLGIPAQVVDGPFYGQYRTVYQWDDEPLISVIIPNKDHSEDLRKCVDSIFEKSTYTNLEFVIAENNSTEPETCEYYDKLTAEHDNVKVVTYEGGFNFASINNFGVKAASGEYLLLLNNDTEMIADGIRDMLGYCMREDVGIVGAKLLYPDDTIQHAGVVLGFGGVAGHTFIGKHREEPGYFGRIQVAQDYSAVTAACLMTPRSVFDAVCGMTEKFVVAFNDIDYCLKVRRLGKLVVYDPYAEFYHYESKSRGLEDSPEKVERFQGETDLLIDTWQSEIEAGDPYYNPNLTLDNSDFSLRR
jgi:GT2 family glycosyltransferase